MRLSFDWPPFLLGRPAGRWLDSVFRDRHEAWGGSLPDGQSRIKRIAPDPFSGLVPTRFVFSRPTTCGAHRLPRRARLTHQGDKLSTNIIARQRDIGSRNESGWVSGSVVIVCPPCEGVTIFRTTRMCRSTDTHGRDAHATRFWRPKTLPGNVGTPSANGCMTESAASLRMASEGQECPDRQECLSYRPFNDRQECLSYRIGVVVPPKVSCTPGNG